MTIKNSGDGEIFIESATYRNKTNTFTGGMTIMVSAQKGEFTTFKRKNSIIGTVVLKEQKFDEKDVIPVFCTENSHAFKGFKAMLKEKMRTFEAEAELNYYSLVKRGIRSIKIPCVGFLQKKQSANKANAADTKSRAAD